MNNLRNPSLFRILSHPIPLSGILAVLIFLNTGSNDLFAFSQQETVDNTVAGEFLKSREMLQLDSEYQTLMTRLRSNGNDIGALNDLGFKLLEYDLVDSAETVFNTSLEIDNDQAPAHTGIGIAYLKRGAGRLIIFQSLKSLFGVDDNFEMAVKKFERALELDPGYNKARYHLGEAYFEKGGDKELEEGTRILNELRFNDPFYPGIYYLLGRVYYKAKNYNAAEKQFLIQIQVNDDHAPAKINIGLLYFITEKPEKASRFYLEGLSRLRDRELLEDIYEDIKPIFTDDENDRYNSISINDRGDFLESYWRRHDPNIISEENERLLEHLRRVNFVEEIYHEKNRRGYDDRGEIYLKYGEPNKKFVSAAMNSDLVRIYPTLKDNESWLYDRLDSNLAYDFVSIGGGPYRYVPDLSYATSRNEIGVAQELYIERAFLGGIYGIVAGRAFNEGSDFESFLFSEFGSQKDQALAAAPAENYNMTTEENWLDLPVTYAQFRGTDNRTEIEIYYGIPLSQLKYGQGRNGFAANVLTHIVGMDAQFNKKTDMQGRKVFETRDTNMSPGSYYRDLERVTAKPGDYSFAFQIKQENQPRLGLNQFDLSVKDFSSNDLMISDLRIGAGRRQPDFNEDSPRRNLRMTPYPFTNFSKSLPLVIYFEIYNLYIDPAENTRYTIEYTVEREQKSSGGLSGIFKKIGGLFGRKKIERISVSNERSGKLTSINELIALDISDFPEGSTLISVTVEDHIRGTITTSERRIMIVK